MNQKIVDAGEYIFSAVRSFRLRYFAYISGLSKKKTKDSVVEKPTHGYIWYAKKYPVWQAIIMDHLSKHAKDGVLPDNRILAADLAKIPELKKYQKRVMTFVATIKERVEKLGIGPGLKQALDFDEKDILMQNLSYLLSSVDVRFFFIYYHVANIKYLYN